jgi:hypothetical protein
MELKPIVFFSDHSSFVTSVTCTSDGRLYALTTFPQYVFVTLETCTPPGWTV